MSAAQAHGSLKSYVVGLFLSLLATALSFGAVGSGLLSHETVFSAIIVLAVVQLLVQLLFFLHLGTAPEQRNNTTIFLLTVVLITTVISGSLWVMHNADINMMPTQMSPEKAMSRN